jgi:hypothetical protein
MISEKMYRYLGRNGTITSNIQLENIAPIHMVKLSASSGKILTDGNKKLYSVTVFEDEVANWYEIDDIGQE